MKRLLILACAVLAVSCTERLTPSGDIIKQSRTFNTAVNVLNVADGVEVYCDDDLPNGTIDIITNSDIQPRVEVLAENGALTIQFKRSNAYRRLTIKARLSADLFDTFDASGGSKIICDQDLIRENLTINASGGSNVDFDDDVVSSNLKILASGGSYVEIEGSCKKLDTELSGGSKLVADDLLAVSVFGDLSGGSKMYISVVSSLVVNATGGSKVYYSGIPSELVSNLSGGSKVVRK